MNLKKSLLLFLGICFLFLFSTSFAFSACSSNPVSTQIYSGNNYLGKFVENDIIYVNPNLDASPLKFILRFENSQDNCYTQKSQISMKVFQSSGAIVADNLVTNSNSNSSLFITTASFNFKISNFLLTGPFVSTYFVNLNNQLTTGSFQMKLDTTNPTISLNLDNQKTIYSKGDIVNIDYQIDDIKSGLESLTISGIKNNIINFPSGTKTSNGIILLNLTNSGTIFFELKDKLSNTIKKNISFFVDSNPPLIINNENSKLFDKIYYFSNSNRKISFNNIIISENSISKGGNLKLFGNFSSFNTAAPSIEANCNQLPNKNYKCDFNNIPISLKTTSNKDIILTTIDSAQNTANFKINTEIFVDTTGPQISDFYILNGINTKNLVSIYDNSTYVYLKFYDDSIKNSNNPQITIIPNFELLQFPNILLSNTSNRCNFDKKTGTGTCIWKLGNSLSIYNEAKKNKGTFRIKLIDKFKNLGDSILSFKIDNKLPIVKNIKLVEQSGTKDGIVKSSETIDFRLFVNDENLENNNKFLIRGDFTSISAKNGFDIREGICSRFNKTSYRCDFNSIKVRIGYRNESINFSISDFAANKIYTKFNVEIFKIANEPQNDIFQIIDMNKANFQNPNFLQILNPINRNKIMKNSATTWFEALVSLKTPTDNFKIVNYGLKGCDFKDSRNPFLLGDIKLYPNSNVIYKKAGDEKFALKIQIKRQSNPTGNDLNDFEMACSLSVLKKDSTTVYSPEIVNFTVKVGFYDLPRGDFLKAHASKVNQLISEANFVGSWFDKTYKLYNMLKSVCTVVSTGGGVLTTVKNILNNIQVITSGAPIPTDPVEPSKKVQEGALDKIMSMLNDKDGFVQKACSYVTCKNGGIISQDNIPGIAQLNQIQNKVAQSICKS